MKNRYTFLIKWFVVPVIVLGLIVGWLVFWKYPVKKEVVSKIIVSDSAEIKALNLPTVKIVDKRGTTKNVYEVNGIVQKWSPDTGEVEFISTGKTWILPLDLKVATICSF